MPEAIRPMRCTTCSAAPSPVCWLRCGGRRRSGRKMRRSHSSSGCMPLVDEHVADSDEGRRTALRRQLARRLLDDPVVYIDSLDADARLFAAIIRGQDVIDFLRDSKNSYGKYWRKSAREPGAERELAEIALERLEKLQLIVRDADTIHPRPALARFALGAAEIRETRGRPRAAADLPFGPI